MHRGRVLDPVGNPLAGIHVYTTDAMAPLHLGVTTADGRFAVTCGDGSLLLWGRGPDFALSEFAADRPWAIQFVGAGFGGAPAPCSTDPTATIDVVMQPGVSVTGVLRGPDGSPRTITQAESGYSIGSTVGGRGVRTGIWTSDPSGRYWVHGLAPGAIVADCMGISLTVQAEPGETVHIDWGPGPSSGCTPHHPGTPP